MPDEWEDNKRKRDEEKYDEMKEDGRNLHYDICLCTDDSFIGCPKHDPLYHTRSRR